MLHVCTKGISSRAGLVAIGDEGHWNPPIITSIKRQAKRVEHADGRVALTWLPYDEDVEGYAKANAAAQRAAKQQPKEMRSASLSYVKQAVETRCKPRAKANGDIAKAKKSVAARYLQLKSGHAVTGAHLLRIGKVEDARCWWCDDSDQTVAHLLLRCRKWRRQRDCMMRGMRAREIPISAMRDEVDLMTMFGEAATAEVLRFIENTEVGRPLIKEGNKEDYWDIEQLDRRVEEEEAMVEDTGSRG